MHNLEAHQVQVQNSRKIGQIEILLFTIIIIIIIIIINFVLICITMECFKMAISSWAVGILDHVHFNHPWPAEYWPTVSADVPVNSRPTRLSV